MLIDALSVIGAMIIIVVSLGYAYMKMKNIK
jgi:hypothetical protein